MLAAVVGFFGLRTLATVLRLSPYSAVTHQLLKVVQGVIDDEF